MQYTSQEAEGQGAPQAEGLPAPEDADSSKAPAIATPSIIHIITDGNVFSDGEAEATVLDHMASRGGDGDQLPPSTSASADGDAAGNANRLARRKRRLGSVLASLANGLRFGWQCLHGEVPLREQYQGELQPRSERGTQQARQSGASLRSRLNAAASLRPRQRTARLRQSAASLQTEQSSGPHQPGAWHDNPAASGWSRRLSSAVRRMSVAVFLPGQQRSAPAPAAHHTAGAVHAPTSLLGTARKRRTQPHVWQDNPAVPDPKGDEPGPNPMTSALRRLSTAVREARAAKKQQQPPMQQPPKQQPPEQQPPKQQQEEKPRWR